MEFRILGPVEMGPAGHAVDLGGPRERALLARLLVSANHVVAAHQIADDLWSGNPPPSSLATLRVYVSRLRRALGPSASALATRQPGYGLYIADDDLDARRFGRLASAGTARLASGAAEEAAEALRAALALWRGHALADMADLPFAQAHAARLEEDRLAAIESLKTAELACGLHAAIIGELEQLTETYPTREQLWILRMLALYRCGRQADALAAYRAVRTVLADELGVDPSQALRQMQDQVLRQDPALDLAPRPPAPRQAAQPPSAPAVEAVGALPSEANAFIGREQELGTMSELLRLSRLLTLTGPGGSGKSRLAIKYASANKSSYPGGVWLVNLAPVVGPEFVVPAIASVLSVTEVAGKPLIDGVIARFAGSQALLIADNCEHVVDAVAEVVALLLASCPGIRILATSQIRLKVDGEASWPVPPLTMPPPGADDAAEISRSESAQLLCDRAALARPGFQLTASNASQVANICRRLDGVPLAIELAAARLNALSIATLAARLDDRFLLLTGGNRAALPRHRALVAAIDWSHDLLTEAEQVCLRRLTVFAGGCTLDAAEVVCCDERLPAGLLFDIIGSLVDKSLLIAQERAGAMRYGMLESIHVYAGRRLDEAGERDFVVGRHLAWLQDLAGHAGSDGPADTAWLDLIQADMDNVMVGLERAVDPHADGRDALAALALATRLAGFWMVRGPVGLGRRLLDAAIVATGPEADPRLLAEALDAAGEMASLQGDQDAQLRRQHQSLEIWRGLGDDAKIASCLGDLGSVAHVRGDYAAADAMYTEALKLATNVANDQLIARCLSGLGRLAFERGDLAKATEYYEESLARFRAGGDLRRATTILGNLGVVATSIGDRDLAQSRLTEHLANARLLGDRKLIGGALTNLGVLAFNGGAGDLAAAAAMQREAAELGELIGDPRLTGVALTNLGMVACARGDYEVARSLFLRGLAMAAKVEDARAIAECIEELAVAESSSGRHERAAHLFGAASQIRDEMGAPIPMVDAHRIAAVTAATEQAMGAEQFDAATAAGRAMTRHQIIAYAESANTPPIPAKP